MRAPHPACATPPPQLLGPTNLAMQEKPVLDDAKRRMIVQLRWLAMQSKKRRDERLRRPKAEIEAEAARIKAYVDKYVARRRAVNLIHVLAADKYKARPFAPRPPRPPPARWALALRCSSGRPALPNGQGGSLDLSVRCLDAMRRLSQYDSSAYMIVEHGGVTARSPSPPPPPGLASPPARPPAAALNLVLRGANAHPPCLPALPPARRLPWRQWSTSPSPRRCSGTPARCSATSD